MATDESTPAPRHKLCTVDQCGDVVYAKGLCQKHYRRWRKHGDAHYERPKKVSQPKCPPPTVCSVEGCGQGYCQTHYNRWKAHGDPLWMPTHGVRRAPAPVALRDAQTRSRLAWVVRARHYERWKRHGNPLHHEHDGKPLCAVEGCPSRALSSAPPEHGE